MKIRFVSKFLSLVFCLVFICSMFVGCATPEEEVKKQNSITVFSVEDYIAQDDTADLGSPDNAGILTDFYRETGIYVNYLTFATNEAMYNELLKAPDSVDLICPSEYMIMKMINEGLIKEFDTPQNLKDYGSKYISDVFKGLEVENDKGEVVSVMSSDGNRTYAVGYMWGTIGLIYNKTLSDGTILTDDDFKTWTTIWERFSGKVTIKDSIRDSYFLALAYVYQDELLVAKSQYEQDNDLDIYSQKLAEIFNRTDVETVKKVEDALILLKDNLYGFEVDAGKNDILTGKIDVNFAWSGDAVCSIEEGMYDEDGNLLDNPTYLGYAVPLEGSNVWFDGYVMTKHANEELALKFLNYLCDPEVAVENMENIGYTSCIAGNSTNTAVFDYVVDSYGVSDGETGTICDLSYFFDPGNTSGDYEIEVSNELLSMFNAQYPSEEVINRCAVMQNFSGEELQRINDMWSRVKLTTLSLTSIWIIVGCICAFIIAFVLIKFRDKIFARKNSVEKTEKKTKYQVIKKEKI